MKVSELMKTHVIYVTLEDTLRDAVDKMDLYQVSGLPVVDEDRRLVGVVTEHDVIVRLLPMCGSGADPSGTNLSQDQLTSRIQNIQETPVKEAMTSPAISIDEGEDALEAVRLLCEKKIKRLPVTHLGKLTGVISRIDICQAVLEGHV